MYLARGKEKKRWRRKTVKKCAYSRTLFNCFFKLLGSTGRQEAIIIMQTKSAFAFEFVLNFFYKFLKSFFKLSLMFLKSFFKLSLMFLKSFFKLSLMFLKSFFNSLSFITLYIIYRTFCSKFVGGLSLQGFSC